MRRKRSTRRDSSEHTNSADMGPLHSRWHDNLGLTHAARTDALYVYE